MAVVRRVWEFINGPSLYKQFNNDSPQAMYDPNRLERWGDQVIHSLNIVWNIGLYTSPLMVTYLYNRGFVVFEGLFFLTKVLVGPNRLESWGEQVIHSLNIVWNIRLYTSSLMVTYLYKRGYVAFEGLFFLTKVLVGIGIILSTSYCMRGIGRMNNPVYVQFLNALSNAKKDLNKDTKKKLMEFDFDFSAWPVEFSMTGDQRTTVSSERPYARRTALDSFVSIPCRLTSYIVSHTIALKMVYPGSIRALQYFMSPILLQGRIKLVESYNAERFKLQARDENDIDIIFVDRRHEGENGKTLVVCCEGNAGFYEVGIMMTPIEAKYSVLGWNHPGFGGSTGAPFPVQEQNAVDAVMQFAIHKLGFMPDEILLFGWSIGGYTSSWAAMNYPDVKGLILDATFDDILPLAISRMPGLEPIIRRVIREYINLNVFENVAKFPGPVTFIRRTEDEMICTVEGNLATNRGNHLVAKILKYRYPKIIDDERQVLLNEWLAACDLDQVLITDRHHVDKDLCQSMLASYIEDNSSSYPMLIGDDFTGELKANLTLFLASKYMIPFRTTHCTPLKVNLFRQPWAPITSESSFVKL